MMILQSTGDIRKVALWLPCQYTNHRDVFAGRYHNIARGYEYDHSADPS